MVHVAVQHKVEDYKAWKAVFDNFSPTRKSGGERSYTLWRAAEDPNDISVLFEWDTLENARTFMKSTELKNAMQKAGVKEQPRIQYLNELDHGTL